jgi:RHS repeat-associated protein
VSYTRGRDLSGSLKGAGGINLYGFVGNTPVTYIDPEGRLHLVVIGGVAILVGWGIIEALEALRCLDQKAEINAGQTAEAWYRYDPYGRTMAQSGNLVNANVYRFSSKELHAKSGMYYYGYRFYEPHLQRWINRDPIGEAGGINLYGFVGNTPVNYIDPEGEKVLIPILIIGGGAYWAYLKLCRAFDKAKERGDEDRDIMEDGDWYNPQLQDRGHAIAAAGAEALGIAGDFPGLIGNGLSEGIWPVTRAGEISKPIVGGFENGL